MVLKEGFRFAADGTARGGWHGLVPPKSNRSRLVFFQHLRLFRCDEDTHHIHPELLPAFLFKFLRAAFSLRRPGWGWGQEWFSDLVSNAITFLQINEFLEYLTNPITFPILLVRFFIVVYVVRRLLKIHRTIEYDIFPGEDLSRRSETEENFPANII